MLGLVSLRCHSPRRLPCPVLKHHHAAPSLPFLPLPSSRSPLLPSPALISLSRFYQEDDHGAQALPRPPRPARSQPAGTPLRLKTDPASPLHRCRLHLAASRQPSPWWLTASTSSARTSRAPPLLLPRGAPARRQERDPMLGFVSSARRPHLISSRAPPSCNQPCLPAGDEQQHRQDSPASPEAVGFLRALAPCRTPCSTSASRACAIVPRRCRLSVHTAAPSSPARQRQVPVIAALLPEDARSSQSH